MTLSKTFTCQNCNQQFESDAARKYCSKECMIAGSRRAREATMMRKYGVTQISQIPGVAEKRAETIMSRYGVPYAVMKNPHRRKVSALEVSACKLPKEIAREVSDDVILKILSLLNVEIIPQYHIDDCVYSAYIPSRKIVVSVNTTANNNTFRLKSSWHHRHMTEVARQHGLNCIHIFDWDNIEKLYMTFQPKKSIYARNCVIAELDVQTTNLFLNMFHLQNSCNAQVARYGLYYNQQLVMVMTFGKSRYSKRFEWELLRLCSDPDYRVVGGASKLFKHFIHTYRPRSIISYCDPAKFDGSVYEAIGMRLENDVAPNKVWSRGIECIRDRLLCTAGYDRLFGTNYGKGTRNEQLMIDNGWLPVYDCGQLTFTWSAESEETL